MNDRLRDKWFTVCQERAVSGVAVERLVVQGDECSSKVKIKMNNITRD